MFCREEKRHSRWKGILRQARSKRGSRGQAVRDAEALRQAWGAARENTGGHRSKLQRRRSFLLYASGSYLSRNIKYTVQDCRGLAEARAEEEPEAGPGSILGAVLM